jgi:hypothetical protein
MDSINYHPLFDTIKQLEFEKLIKVVDLVKQLSTPKPFTTGHGSIPKPITPTSFTNTCQGTTKNGEPCRMKVKPGETFCWRHQHQHTTSPHVSKRCSATTANGTQCKNWCIDGTPFCASHQPITKTPMMTSSHQTCDHPGCNNKPHFRYGRIQLCNIHAGIHETTHHTTLRCDAIIKSGDRKGQLCGAPVKANGKCGRHQHF